jgi:single-stranded DNA-binding protein
MVSLIGFAEAGERLLRLAKGSAVAVSGRARLNRWVDRDGVEKHGISIVAEQIAAAWPRSAAGSQRRVRNRSPSPRSTRDMGPPLPADRVDDLWQDGLVP